MPTWERCAFDGFVLERSQRRVLRADGTALSLTPRLFDALLFFVEHAGELLDKDTLMRELWPGLVVEENNLSQTVSALRRALGDDTSGRCIQTVPRRGFRFIATVTPLADGEAAPPTPAGAPALDAAPTLEAPTRRAWLRSALVGGGAAVGGAAWLAWHLAGRDSARPVTLAVLPFKPLHAEGRDELLELGMADSLATRLSTVPGLVVRSVGSVSRFAGAQQDLARAARELDVAWLVDGSLQRRGDDLRVNARLLRTSDLSAAWSASFDEKFTGVFDVQDQISERVQEALIPLLRTHAGTAPVTRAHGREVGGTRNVEAYRVYLEASAQMLQQRGDGLRRSISLFNKALDIDPTYALAWTALADAHGRTAFIGHAEPRVAYAVVEVALQRALALAPNLGEAHASLGYKLYAYDYDWPAGEKAFRQTISLNPNVARAYFALGQMLLTQDRIDEGLVHMRVARELDPLQPIFSAIEASFLLLAGRTQEGRARLARTFEMAPRLPLAFLVKGQQQIAAQQTDDGIASLRQAVTLAGGATIYDALLGFYLARLGQTDEARSILGQLREKARGGYVAGTQIAVLHAGLAQVEPALDALELAYTQRDPRLVFVKDQPYWEGLRKQPRFAALLKRLGMDRLGPGLWNP